MSDVNALENFDGRVRLFPLPNLVVFPHVVQPLHIFEPRYRQLMADALLGDRLIAMALLRPGWEEGYHDRPPIHPVVCVGKIMQEEMLPDGRYNLLLSGVSRARVLEEVPTSTLYRVAEVELLADVDLPDTETASNLRERLGMQLDGKLAAHPEALKQLRRLIEGELPLAALVDIVSFALPLPVEFKQSLLAETRVSRRLELLLDHLEPGPIVRRFPPDFSPN